MAFLTGNDENLIKAFEDAKLVPAGCRRIIIDIPVDDAVKLFYECYGDEHILQLDLPKVLRSARRIPVAEAPEVQNAPTKAET